jgi:hypothetical protein
MAAANGLWSVNALALEFDMDRRTVTQILRGVRPAGRLKGHPAWRLRDAAGALLRYASTSPTMSMRRAQADHRRAHTYQLVDGLEEEPDPEAPPCPDGLELVREAENPIDKGFALAATMAGAEVPRLVAVQAVGKGLPVAEAYDLANTVLLVLGAIVGKRAASLGIEPWASLDEPDLDGPVLGEGMFTLINWPSLAHRSGAPDWTPPTYFGPWIELSPKRRAELVAQGMAEEEAFTAELAAEESADGGPVVR